MRVLLHSKSQIVADVPGFEREPDTEIADADLSAEEMGRLCYLSGHRPSQRTATNDRYLLNICKERHYSVLGHGAASFYIETSRNTTHEIIRSRWFTFSEVSQRYVDASHFDFVEHPGLAPIGDSERELLNKALETAHDAYNAIFENLTDEAGYKLKEARQAARSILPGGIGTMIGMSGNLRAWRDFLAQRLSPAADAEIRAVALEIYKIMKVEFPNSFQDFDSQGLITHERLVNRARLRRDLALAVTGNLEESLIRFSKEIDLISKEGLWILKDDPWVEGEA